MPSPIELMIQRADLQCTICNKPQSVGCQCWTRCRCGWSFEAGTACRNPDHALEKACRELAQDLAGSIILDMRHRYPEPMKHASGGFAKTLKAIIELQAMETLMVVYKSIDEAKPTDTGSVT